MLSGDGAPGGGQGPGSRSLLCEEVGARGMGQGTSHIRP